MHVCDAYYFPLFSNFQISRSSDDKKCKDEGGQEVEGGAEVDGKW